MAQPPRSARAVLAAGIAVGLGTLVALPALHPEQVGIAARVYTVAAEAALAGDPIYAAAPAGLPGFRFVYPPVVLLAFLPYGLLGDPGLAYAGQLVLTLLAGLALGAFLVGDVRRAGVALGRVDRGLVYGFVIVSAHAAPTLVNGQVNVVLGLLVAGGVLASERGRAGLAGVTLALAATVKLFPATLGAFLLRQRDWATVAVATGSGLALLGLGVVAFGIDTTVTYLTTVVPGESQAGALAADPLGNGFLTVRRQLAALLPWVPGAWLPLFGVAVVAPFVALALRHLQSRLDRRLAVLAVLVGTLLVLPLEALYFPLVAFPLVPLLYTLPRGRTRQLLLAGTVLTFANLTPPGLESLLATGVLGPDLAAAVEAVAMSVFRVVLPPTVGMWLLLAGAVHWQVRGRAAAAVDTDRPVRSQSE